MNNIRYKIMINPKKIDDNEIESYKNFDSLLKKSMMVKKAMFIKNMVLIATFVSLSVGGIFYAYKYQTEESTVAGNNKEKITSQPIIASDKDSSRISDATLKQNIVSRQEEKINSKKSDSLPKQTEQGPAATKEKKKGSPKETEGYASFQEAVPMGGFPELFSFFSKNLNYPEKAHAEGKSGSVLVEFYINTKGKAEQIEIVNGISPEIDQEAIRLVSIMPEWQPAVVEGKPISVRQVLPITFILEDNK